jgi:succinate dehydrogenase/fumarate reductase cytochrome b subunit
MRVIQRVTSVLIVIFVIGVVLTGLNGYDFIAQVIEDVIPFAPHRILDLFLVSAIIIHVGVGIRFFLMRRRQKSPLVGVLVAGLVISLLLVTTSLNLGAVETPVSPGPVDSTPVNGTVYIAESSFNFTSDDVETVRPDIFQPGTFSMFDILVNLADRGLIELEYHYNESMDMHVIDSLEGESNWWYEVTFSGGWRERNAHRMDQYPWKEGTHLKFYQESSYYIEWVYREFQEEVARFNENQGQVIIPEVFISSPQFSIYVEDLIVTPHNLRNDTLKVGVITAIDVIMTLADQGLLEYELHWYDSLGDADVVRSYWVSAINGQTSYGTCGWVYESGSWDFSGFFGNHIHLPSDVRVLNSPEYVEWFWICI